MVGTCSSDGKSKECTHNFSGGSLWEGQSSKRRTIWKDNINTDIKDILIGLENGRLAEDCSELRILIFAVLNRRVVLP